ncbi:hypothetical protein HMN09_00810300 [Mycena chlorophos]|uniref:Abscisic acid G-protein coupled receptor-domain-containing protein n=1 Tax=Mycena chlorophos TaxID=658473 RepID=A0A8H6SU81_MYCCL|nr:hypothetical protein HMN09_00810300 [Mycena chlorophos]
MITETTALIALRAAIFFSCRRWLLHTLYSNLDEPDLASDINHIPLRDPLPSPITQAERDKPWRKPPTRARTEAGDVFAACAMEAGMLLVLLLMQAAEMGEASVRMLHWRISLFLLLALVLVCIPFLLSLLLTLSPDDDSRLRPTPTRLLFSAFAVNIHLLLISFVPLPSPAEDYTTAALSRLIVVGTVILGLLAGYGAATSVWTYFPLGETLASPTEHEFISAKESLAAIRDDIEQKRAEGRRRAEAAATGQGPTWLARVLPSFRGDEDTQVLAGLTALEEQMTMRVEALLQRRQAAAYARTWYGRLGMLVGRVFALYCAFRILLTTITFFLPALSSRSSDNSSTDLTTRILTTLVPPLSDNPQLASRIARHASLLLVGAIILSSLRRVVRGVTRALRVTSRVSGAKVMVLVVAWVMSVYVLATIVQLRGTFPPSSLPAGAEDERTEVAAETNLFSTIPPFAVFGPLFDGAFLLAAGGAIGGRWVGDKVGGGSA